MTTQKMLSTISFNTEIFLKKKLEELIENKVIDFYCYIKHKAEEDTTKDHIHLLIEPINRIDTEKLREYFQEISILSSQPLGCLPFQITGSKNFGDWYLYILHDIDYLNDKGLTRVYHYKKEEVKTNSLDFLDFFISQININIKKPKAQIKSLVNNGFSWEYIILNTNIVPLQQLKQYKEFYDMYYKYAFDNGLIINKNDVKNANLEDLIQDVEEKKTKKGSTQH